MLPFLLVQKRATNLFLFFPLSWDWSLVKMWEHCQSLYKQLKWCPEVDTTTVQWYWSHLPNFPSYLYCWRHGPVLGGPKIANLWQLSVCQLFFLIKFCVGCGTFATYNRWKSSATFGCKGSEMVTIQAHIITPLQSIIYPPCSQTITCAWIVTISEPLQPKVTDQILVPCVTQQSYKDYSNACAHSICHKLDRLKLDPGVWA